MRLFLRQREPSIRRSEWNPAPARAPEGARVYAIGDIHGRLDLLKMLVAAIEEEQRLLPPARPTVVFVGDYVDRGPDSCGVIDWLCERPLPDFERVHLRGNHEEWFEDFLTDISVGAELALLRRGGDARKLRHPGGARRGQPGAA